MVRCDRHDCGLGDIDDQGFCTECHRAPLHPPVPPPPARNDPQVAVQGPAVPRAWGERAARAEPWWGLSLIEPGAAPPVPAETGEAGPLVPEDKRACPNGHPVPPDRPRGYCRLCGRRYDYTRRPLEIRGDRYEIYRKLGSGAFGSALLAYDRNLETDVVLKDLTKSVAATATAERNALVALRHDNIVSIYGYEPTGPYLILEYVRGTPLSGRADDRLEVILGHGLQVLQALDYLHARHLLHMDVKPANIIRFSENAADGPHDRVRLIDFGAVRELDRRGQAEIYTPDYAPPNHDPEHRKPTAGFDLYCLGMTLKQLSRPHVSRGELTPGVAALTALLNRATDDRHPENRFVSARQFAEQLSGVIRQVVAGSPAERRVTRQSAIFAAITEPLDGGLAAARPLAHWTRASLRADGVLTMSPPFAVPAPADLVAVLPAPLADSDDPDLTQPCEASLSACRAALRRGEVAAAGEALRQAGLPSWAWIQAWYSGLLALAKGDADGAADYFKAVRAALPGELIPLLALGLCEENRGKFAEARHLYETVTSTDRAFSAAAFGLARLQLLDGRRDKAVATAEDLAGELQAGALRFEQAARIAAVRLLAAVSGDQVPTAQDLERAKWRAVGLQLPGDTRAGLIAEIQYGRSRITGNWLALSEEFRNLAAFARNRGELFAMVDLANQLRPPVTWPWRRRRRASSEPLTDVTQSGRPTPQSRDATQTRGLQGQ